MNNRTLYYKPTVEMYAIIDNQTGQRIGKLYGSRSYAARRADRLDNEYGAYRYFVKMVLVEGPDAGFEK